MKMIFKSFFSFCVRQNRFVKFRNIAVKIFLSGFVCCFFVGSLFSSENTLTVTPMRAEITIDAGGYYENDYSVTNNYDGEVEVEISFGKKESYTGNSGIALDSWLYVDTATITLQKGETKTVHYKVQTSTDMTGNISGQVSFTTRPPGNEMMRARMTFPIYVNIRGTENVAFDVSDIKLSGYFGKTLGTIAIKNTGNVHITPRGFFAIMKGKKTIYSGNIREGLIVFSGTTRKDFEFQIPEGIKFKKGKYKMHVTVSAKGKELRKKVNIIVDESGNIRVK